MFSESPFDSIIDTQITLDKLFLVGDVWSYFNHVITSFHWKKWYEDHKKDPNRTEKNTLYDNILLGVPRLRQLRVGSSTCTLDPIFKNFTRKCYGHFSSANEDRTTSKENENSYSASTSGVTYFGKVSNYHSGGFVVNLPTSPKSTIDNLMQKLWIDRSTRALFLEFTSYNANVNLFCIGKYTGICTYFSGLARMVSFKRASINMYATKAYVNLEIPALFQVIQDSFTGIFTFFVYIKLFKYFKNSKIIGQLNHTFNKCVPEIISFAILFATIFTTFGISAHLAFGNKIPEYRNFCVSFFTLMRAVLGDFDYKQIKEGNQYMAPIFYLIFVFVNMFLALVNDTYDDVNAEFLCSSKRTEDYTPKPSITLSIYKYFRNKCRRTVKEPVQELIDRRNPYEKITEELGTALLRCGFKDVEVDMFFDRFNIDPTSSIGQFDANEILADLNGEAYDLKTEDKNTGAISSVIGIDQFKRQKERLFNLELNITVLTSKIDMLLRKLDTMENISQPERF
ncbi:hypothetical protein RI129_000693 [Pyrocoelia pectoralis]|uniref:Polycystic kidney disease 2-like 1 protein n=1 Tax=Pyrocoelia pectoralis TaxID=417401 RepID=A0AAN7VTV4_9COLE